MQQQNSRRKRRSGLTVVISIVIVLISLITTTAVSWINYQQYLDAVITVHTTEIGEIGRLIGDCMTPDEWRHYAGKLQDYGADRLSWWEIEDLPEEEAFLLAQEKIQQITDRFQLGSVSVFVFDPEQMKRITADDPPEASSEILYFMMDFYVSDSDRLTYDFADTDSWWTDYEDFEAYRELLLRIVETGTDEAIYEDLEDGGTLLTEYCPVFVDDRFTAMISLSLSVNSIQGFMESFFVRTLVFGLGITLALVGVAIVFFFFRIVRPLRVMTDETQAFIANNATVSGKLPAIRTRDELQELAESFLRMEHDLRAYVDEVTRVTSEKEHIQTELNVATRIQEDMLPRTFPPYPDRKEFSIFASMDPAREVGGDFYDFFFVDDDHFAMVIADVAGKGVPASLFMVIAKTLIKSRTMQGGTPAEILRDVNDQLCIGNESNMFVTVWMAIVDVTTGQGVAANAGHEHPIRRDAGGAYALVQYRHSPAVAMYEGMRFREHTFELKPHDRLFVYTDGLPEATNAGDELFGTGRILEVLNGRPGMTLEETLPAMTEAVAAFVGEAPQFDDLTMLVFEYHGKAEA